LSKNNTGWSKEAIRIKIEYDNQLNDEPKFIHIFEDNSSQIWGPNYVMEPVYYTEGETNITQQKGHVEFISRDGQLMMDKYNFFWKNNDINFNVDICGYDLETSRQVIKSMLQ
jgi:predicted SAM-dependent methyltransferase